MGKGKVRTKQRRTRRREQQTSKMEAGNNSETGANKAAPDNAWSWDPKESLKKIAAGATAVFNFLSNEVDDTVDSAKTSGMNVGLTLLSKISEQKTEKGLLALLNENAEKFADDPPSIKFLANNINNFKDKDLIGQTLQIFDIALGGPNDLKCSNVIIHSKFFWEKNIDDMYRLPDESLLNVLCKLANNVEKHQTIKFTVKQESALKERIEGIISGNEIGFVRYAGQNQLTSKLTVNILSTVCSRVASNPRSAYGKYNKIGSLLTKILWKYEGAENICDLCLVSLAELTFKKDSAPGISDDIIPQINKYAGQVPKVMRRHIENTEILRVGFKVIVNIACDEKAVRNIMANDFVDLVRDARDDDFNRESTYKYWRVRALWELSRNPRSRSELETDPKIVATMVEGLMDNWKNIKFAYPCCAFLDSIKMNDVVVKMFSDDGLDLLEKIKTMHKGDRALVKAVKSLIEKLKPLIPGPSDVSQQSMNDTQNELVNSQERFDGLSSSSSESLQSSSGSSLTLSRASLKCSRSVIGFDHSSVRRSCILCYERTEPNFYIPFVDSLKEAEIKNIDSIVKYSREVASYLKRKGLLKEYGMSEADAMSIATYTYDNGSDQFEDNVYRIINSTLGKRNTDGALCLRGCILHLLVALRKLGPYKEKDTLYRAVSGRINPMYNRPGSELSWSGFTSTSSDENTVIDFFNTAAVISGPKYIFEIQGCFKNGYKISEFSFHPDEEEILFEPETKIKVIDTKPDSKVPNCTRVFVEILESPPVLKEVVGRFGNMCKKNSDKENFGSPAEEVITCPAYFGPIVPASERKGIWCKVLESFKGYFSFKKTLMFMGEEGMKKLLLDFKSLAVDDEFGEAAAMMRGYQLSLEEGAAIYSYSFSYGEKSTPAWALNGALGGEGKFPPEGLCYLLYIISALQKLPEWGHMGDYDDDDDDDDGDDDENSGDGDDDENGNKVTGGTCVVITEDLDDDDDDDDKSKKVVDQSGKDDDNILYVVMKKKDWWKPVKGETFVLNGMFVGRTEKPVWKEDEFLLRIKKPMYLHGREVGPLTAWGSTGYILAGPGCRAIVDSIEPGSKDSFIVTATAINEKSEIKKMNECLKQFVESAPLPYGWSIEEDEDSGRLFYQNDETGQTQWVRPVDEDPNFFTDFKVNKSEQQQDPTISHQQGEEVQQSCHSPDAQQQQQGDVPPQQLARSSPPPQPSPPPDFNQNSCSPPSNQPPQYPQSLNVPPPPPIHYPQCPPPTQPSPPPSFNQNSCSAPSNQPPQYPPPSNVYPPPPMRSTQSPPLPQVSLPNQQTPFYYNYQLPQSSWTQFPQTPPAAVYQPHPAFSAPQQPQNQQYIYQHHQYFPLQPLYSTPQNPPPYGCQYQQI